MENWIGTEVKTTIRKKKAVKRPNGRPLMFPDKTIVRMPAGFLKRVNDALKEGEFQGDFMRSAVLRELKMRRK
jgi:ribosomal protein L14